jgi:hypothetical protein
VRNSIKEGNGCDIDLNLLRHVKDLSWLSTAEMTSLAGGLAIGNFKRHEVILGDSRLVTEAYILLSGVANISCLNAKRERVILALIPPGPIPDFPFQSNNRLHFQCDACSKCKLGSLSWVELPRLSGRRRACG